MKLIADIVSEPKPTVVWENKSKRDVAKSKSRFTYVFTLNGVRYFWGRVPNFNPSEARKHFYLGSDWLNLKPFPKTPQSAILYWLLQKRDLFKKHQHAF